MFPTRATVAVNPLQWFATDDGWLDWGQAPPWPELMAEVKRAGFDAVHTRVPPDMPARQYGQVIRDAGLQPAPGTTMFDLPGDGVPLEQTLGAFRRTASGYAELGLRHIFILANVVPGRPRVRRPAQGTDASQERLDAVVDLLTRVGQVGRDEGVLLILHPHVGTWVETADETRYVLDHVDASLLGFGPDVGHLSWAGADPSELAAAYRDRVHGAHLKDFHTAVIAESKAAGRTYQQTVAAGLWTEPGRGDFDYDRFWDALGPDFAGTLVVEVDRGALQPPFESARASAEWAARMRG